MKKKIKLLTQYGSLIDREPFLCDVGEPLELEFESVYRLSDAVVYLGNGSVFGKYRMSTPFLVDPKFLVAGELNVEVRRINGAQETVGFVVEPILIKELGDGIKIFPEVDEWKRLLAEYAQQSECLARRVKELEQDRLERRQEQQKLTERIELMEKNYDPLTM